MKTGTWFDAKFSEIRPKAIGYLNRQFRDMDIAEEAFATSCLKALKNWPDKGLPDDPLAWLLTVSRNAGLDIIRKNSRVLSDAGIDVKDIPEDVYIEHLDSNGLRDDVLRLLFICCHPSLSPQDQSAVALRLVTGMSVKEIAAAFLVKTKTMEQRITRAKKVISDANIPFEIPSLMERNNRLNSVMLMLYLLFNEGWSANSGEVQIKVPLMEEALRLSTLLLSLFSGVSELMGLQALFLFQHSRSSARLDAEGKLVPLDKQDRAAWDQEKITKGQNLLEKALRHATPGPYQIQAAISAVHARSKSNEVTDWNEIERLYSALYILHPTAVVKLNHASVVAKIKGAATAIEMLLPLKSELSSYRWYHASLGAFYFEIKDFNAAHSAYQKVLSLDPTAQETLFVKAKIAECKKYPE